MSHVQFSSTGGYFVVASNALGSATSQVATLTVLVPPTIVSAPHARTNLVGTTATFTVTVTNTATLPITYRWRKGNITVLNKILNQRTATLTLSNVSAGDAANYSVALTNIASTSASSASARLTVTNSDSPPLVTLSTPAGAPFLPPANISLSADASDSDGLIDRVEFYSGDTLLGTTFAGSPYLFSWNNVAAGSYTITARAFDNFEATTVSDPIHVIVEAPPNISSIALSGSEVTITFPTSAGHDYQLETALEVIGPWVATGDSIASDGSPKTLSPPTTSDKRRFFRVARNN